MMIYADNAATTKMDIDAFEAMKPFLLENFGNASQPYSFSRASKKALKQARSMISECIGALPEEIYFTSGGTESDNWAIKGSTILCTEIREIITSEIEHHAILNTCATIVSLGFPVVYLPVDRGGVVQPTTLREKISHETKLVSIMLANNEIGTIQPIKELCSIAHENGCLFHTDAVQAVGHIPIDVKKLGVDMLSASAHKFNGPKGVGFLYIKKGVEIDNLLCGGGQERKKRAGTENVPGIVGMAVALENNIKHLNANSMHLKKLETRTLELLKNCHLNFSLNGSRENRLPGNINISIKNIDGEALLHLLDLKGICVSSGSACDSVETQVSHVIQAINVPNEFRNGTLRISYGKNNNTNDVLELVETLNWAVDKLNKR